MTKKFDTKKPENALNFREESSASDTKPAQLAKIIYAGLVRLKATKEAQKCGRNRPIELDFGQPERVNTVAKIDKMERKCK